MTWVAKLTNWLAFLYDRAGLTFAPGAACDNPLLLYQAVLAVAEIAATGPVLNTPLILNTPGTAVWTPVAGGPTTYFAQCWGGGGGGGGSYGGTSGGSSGGGGEYREGIITVVPGQPITLIVGAGGAGGAGQSNTNGTAGGLSSIGSIITAMGGGYGYGGYNGLQTSSLGTPGTGGAGGDRAYAGEGGNFPIYIASANVLTAQGGSSYRNGNPSLGANTGGHPAVFDGAGGGGGSYGGAGGSGAHGRIEIRRAS